MPQASFGAEHKTQRAYDYPKIFLDKGERVRLVVIDQSPVFEYVHNLKKPQIVNGEVQMESVRTRDGGQDQRPKEDFVGRFICTGDVDTLDKTGKDAANCVLCEESEKGDAIWGPQRRWVVHVVRYNIKHGTFDVAEPFGVQVVAWAFSDKIFNKLVDFNNQWGDLRERDLFLGPCEVKQFQKFDIAVAPDCAWTSNDEFKKATVLAFKENKSDDLTALLGRRVTDDVMRQKADEVLAAHRQAFGGPAASSDTVTATEAVAAVDLDALVEEDVKPAPAAEVPADDAPPAAEAPATESKGDDALDFDDLLNSV